MSDPTDNRFYREASPPAADVGTTLDALKLDRIQRGVIEELLAAPRVPRLPHVESADDLRWFATHEALSRHKTFDVLMALAEAMETSSDPGT